MIKDINKQIKDDIFKGFAKSVEIFLRSTKTKSSNYDKYRNIGFDKTILNPIFIKAVTKTISGSSLIYKEIGLVESGAVEMVVRDSDVAFLKLSERIKFEGIEYTVWNEALGNKFQVFPSAMGYSKVIVFRKIK